MEENRLSDVTIQKMLASMEAWNASDLFLVEDGQPAVRIHGDIVPLSKLPATSGDMLREFVSTALPTNLVDHFHGSGDLDAGYSLPTGKRFRFSLGRERGRMTLVARSLPSGDLDLATLGLPEGVGALADTPRGLVLVTGATGSGKSTTLAAMINRINKLRPAHIVTIEDPIEFIHQDRKAHISQREVGADTASFEVGLKHVVRQSPDVIMIGELRDFETMSVAVSAALTGHLVLASMHTVDTTQTLQRILSYVPEHRRIQMALDLSLALKGVVSQRLLPRSDGAGRALAVELLTVTPTSARLIREQRVDELVDLLRSSNDPGIIPFQRSLLGLYQNERVSYDVARAYATNPEEFALAAKGMATGSGTFRTGARIDAQQGLDMKVLLGAVMEYGASDLHLTVGRPPILRCAGTLRELGVPALSAGDMRLLLFSILNTRQRSLYEIDREIDFALALDGGQRFRVNAYYQKGNMAASLRAISSQIPDSSVLGLPNTVLDLGDKPHGLLLVVGPTGAGKTTTLACLIDRINRSRACRIITVEDPIEYSHKGVLSTIDQREVLDDTRSFAAALKYVLRQDPDVIMVGEMRDLESISAALTAAETGHLVMATLHTNDAAQSIDRIIDIFPPYQQPQVRSQLAACLLGVISQRLLPRKNTSGRIGVFEVLVGNAATRALIRENKVHQILSMMETHRASGMVTMDRALKELYDQDLIHLEDARKYLRNPKSLADTTS